MQSSLVGAIIKAYPLYGLRYYLWRALTIGSKNDNVLPLPVSERQSKSFDFKLS